MNERGCFNLGQWKQLSIRSLARSLNLNIRLWILRHTTTDSFDHFIYLPSPRRYYRNLFNPNDMCSDLELSFGHPNHIVSFSFVPVFGSACCWRCLLENRLFILALEHSLHFISNPNSSLAVEMFCSLWKMFPLKSFCGQNVVSVFV